MTWYVTVIVRFKRFEYSYRNTSQLRNNTRHFQETHRPDKGSAARLPSSESSHISSANRHNREVKSSERKFEREKYRSGYQEGGVNKTNIKVCVCAGACVYVFVCLSSGLKRQE